MINTQMRKLTIYLMAMLMVGAFSTEVLAQEKTAAGLYNEGLALLKEKNYVDGLKVIEQALEKATADENEKVIGLAKKNGAMAAYNVGNGKMKTGAHDEAMALYVKGIAMNPEYGSNYKGQAKVHQEKGNHVGAIEAYMMAADKYRVATKAKSESDAKKRAKGVVTSLYKKKDYAAVVTAGKAYLSKVQNPDVHYYVAKSLIQTGDNAAAVTHADQAITAAGADVNDKFYMAKGEALENQKKIADAVAVYKLVKGDKYGKSAAYKVQTLKI